nr:hypothetical protein [Candidatus Freyarchaeota archaeon]
MIEGFVRLLRERNIRVGMAETIDACKAFSLLKIDKETMREGLAACLVKDEIDRPDFDRIFDLYFCNLLEESTESQRRRAGEGQLFQTLDRQEREQERMRRDDTGQPQPRDQQRQWREVLARFGGVRGIGRAIDENDLEGAAEQLMERIR